MVLQEEIIEKALILNIFQGSILYICLRALNQSENFIPN